MLTSLRQGARGSGAVSARAMAEASRRKRRTVFMHGDGGSDCASIKRAAGKRLVLVLVLVLLLVLEVTGKPEDENENEDEILLPTGVFPSDPLRPRRFFICR